MKGSSLFINNNINIFTIISIETLYFGNQAAIFSRINYTLKRFHNATDIKQSSLVAEIRILL